MLDDVVYNLWKGCQEIGGIDLWVKEDLGSKESLVTNIDTIFLQVLPIRGCEIEDERMELTYLPRDSVLSFVAFKVLVWLCVVFPELFHDILTHITVILLNLSSNLQLIFRRDGGHVPSLTDKIQNKLGDITTGNGYMLNSTANDISLGARDNVCDTIPGINNCSSECAVCYSVR